MIAESLPPWPCRACGLTITATRLERDLWTSKVTIVELDGRPHNCPKRSNYERARAHREILAAERKEADAGKSLMQRGLEDLLRLMGDKRFEDRPLPDEFDGFQGDREEGRP